MFKSIKQKVSDSITTHPKLATFGIGLAITFVVSLATGLIEGQQQANAFVSCGRNCGG